MKKNKDNQKQNAEYNAFQQALKGIIGNATHQQIADKIGVTRQNVSRWLLEGSTAAPDADALCKIADAYGVTTDYLLGRTPIKSPDLNLKSACDYTGLTEESLRELNRLKEYQDDALYPYNYLDNEGFLQMRDLLRLLFEEKLDTQNINGEQVTETYFSMIMQAVINYIEAVYYFSDNNSYINRSNKNGAKSIAVDTFKIYLDALANRIANDMKAKEGRNNNGNS